jgi:hypothetical protein
LSEQEFADSEKQRLITEAKKNAAKAKPYDNPKVLTELEAASSEAYRIVKPLIEMKYREIQREQDLQTHLDSLMQSIEANTKELANVKGELSELRQLHSVNAEKESKVLDELLKVL